MGRIPTKTRTINSSGDVVDDFASLLVGYEIANREEDLSENQDGTAYYGYIDADGNWYIQRESNATGDTDFSSGTSDYTTNWTNRASLVYQKFNDEF